MSEREESGSKWGNIVTAAAKNFRGTSYHSTDEKARISVPARFREVLKGGEIDGVMVSRMDGALVAYPFDEWETIENRIPDQGQNRGQNRKLRRFFIGVAQGMYVRQTGTHSCSPILAGLRGISAKGEIALVGAVNHFEIWNKAKFEEAYEAFEDDLNNGVMDDEIEEMGL